MYTKIDPDRAKGTEVKRGDGHPGDKHTDRHTHSMELYYIDVHFKTSYGFTEHFFCLYVILGLENKLDSFAFLVFKILIPFNQFPSDLTNQFYRSRIARQFEYLLLPGFFGGSVQLHE